MIAAGKAAQGIADDVVLGQGVEVHAPVNLYGCEIGDGCRIGTFVEIQKKVKVGRRCKISTHSFLCEGVTLGNGVFIGHGVMFVNDRHPRALGADGELKTEAEWECLPTSVEDGASIGSGCTILGGLTIGRDAMVGAGSVVTRDVAPGTTVVGNPARVLKVNTPLAGSEA
ncbi:MAG: acyltransferase [Verrucomicrobiota bacterium]